MNLLFFAFNLPRLNLHAQIALVLLLSIGVLLARVKRFRLHAILPSAVVLLNLGYILRILLPSLRHRLPAYRRWMWTVFVLWWDAFLLGCLVYYQWYVNP